MKISYNPGSSWSIILPCLSAMLFLAMLVFCIYISCLQNLSYKGLFSKTEWEWKWTRSFIILTYNSSDMIKEVHLLEALLSVRQSNLKNWSCQQDDIFILRQLSRFWNLFFPHCVETSVFLMNDLGFVFMSKST